MSRLSPEASAALSRSLAQVLIREVAACGGEVSDVLAVTTAVAARVLCMTILPDPENDTQATRIMCEQIAACVPVFRDAEREGVVS